MHTRILITTLALLAVTGSGTASAAFQGKVSVFLETSATTGSIATFDEATGTALGTAPGLADVRLLDIDFIGRTPLFEFLPLRARRIAVTPQVHRLALSGERGSLYRFVREEVWGRSYGFLFIDRAGEVHRFAELPGRGATGDEDPYSSFVAFSPGCKRFLVWTHADAGGNVLEIDITTGVVIDRTAKFPPLRLTDALALTDDWGAAVTQSGVLRFGSGPSDHARLVPFSGATPTWFSGDLVTSNNGSWAAIIAGASRLDAHVFVFDAQSAAIQVTTQGTSLAGAGFLPTDSNGPFLAVSDDGRLAAWRRETTTDQGTQSAELFLGRVPLGQAGVEDHLSSDARFLDTLDEIGQVFFLDPRTLSFTVGERELGTPEELGMTSTDVFRARLPATSNVASIFNVSQTNGQMFEPFTVAPNLKPRTFFWLPDRRRFVMHDDGAEAIVALDPSFGAQQVLLDQVKDSALFEATTAGILTDARRTDAAGGAWELYRQSGGIMNPLALVSSSPVPLSFERAITRSNGRIAFVSTNGVSEQLSRIDLASGNLEVFAGAGPFGPTLGHSPAGAVVLSMIAPSGTSFLVWPAGSAPAVTLVTTNTSGFVLPGA